MLEDGIPPNKVPFDMNLKAVNPSKTFCLSETIAYF